MRKQFLTLLLIANVFHFAGQAQTANAANAQTMLNAEVTRTEIKQENEAATALGVGTSEVRTKPSTIIINGSRGLDGLSRIDGLFDKLHTTRLTAQQYREMNYGVIGIMVEQSLTEHLPVIIDLLPECPAMLAGLQKGDELVEANGNQFEPGQGQLEFMRVIGGEAGTNVDLTVNRDGKKVKYNLVRMNVEDITDNQVRMRYETILTLMKRSKRGISATH